MSRKKKVGRKKGSYVDYREGSKLSKTQSAGYNRYLSNVNRYYNRLQKFIKSVWYKEYKTAEARSKQQAKQALYGLTSKNRFEKLSFDQFRDLYEQYYYKFNVTAKNRAEYAYDKIKKVYRAVSDTDVSEVAKYLYKRVTKNDINTALEHSKQYQFNDELINWFTSAADIKTQEDIYYMLLSGGPVYDKLVEIKNRYFPDDTNIEAFYC